jgi:hypothetical protein
VEEEVLMHQPVNVLNPGHVANNNKRELEAMLAGQEGEETQIEPDIKRQNCTKVQEKVPARTLEETEDKSKLYVYPTSLWSGTLALVSRKDGRPTPVVVLSAYPQLSTGEEPDIPNIFRFGTWPIQLLVSGICPAKAVIIQHRAKARVITFKILNKPPLEQPTLSDQPQPSNPQSTISANSTAQPTNLEPSNATPAANSTSTVQQPNASTNPDDKSVVSQDSSSEPTSYINLMLAQLHRKGLAAVVELPHNTLLIVSHKDKPLGILFPKLELRTRPQDPATAPPPTPGISTCVVCMDNPAMYAMVPCGHLCICQNDLQAYRASAKGNQCPVCRSVIERSLRIFST